MIQDLQFGAILMVVGMGMVFLILALLWGVIALFQKIDRRVLEAEDDAAPTVAAASRPDADIPPDLMAAIMVALDQYRREASGMTSPLRRRLPQEINQGQARWVAVGRAYQLRSNIVPRRRKNR
jgi:sodium pump decarboxylase gamma subunit